METLLAPSRLPENLRLGLKLSIRPQFEASAELSPSQEIVNDWLTVTNWVPPVNEAEGYGPLLKAGNTEDTKG